MAQFDVLNYMNRVSIAIIRHFVLLNKNIDILPQHKTYISTTQNINLNHIKTAFSISDTDKLLICDIHNTTIMDAINVPYI